MIEIIPRNIFRFIVLVLIQVLILNNIEFSGYINPFLYVLFILLLPFETPAWLLLVSGFVLGLTVDLFMNTPGLHAAATVLMAFVRPFVLRIFAPRDGYEPGTFPRIFYYGVSWFFKYSALLIVIHHFFLFYLEVFRFTDFFSTFSRVILSSVFSIILVVLSQFVMFRK
ncbi:MAG TPA: rod shape-determining protein MreD [Bacteroidetes bacterium]|nr:rod shape-determining protein MreD [Bacteroidota bacterium]